MKEVKNNESDMESALKEIELLEQKKEFSCVVNVCKINFFDCAFNW